jgi:hypothetical protein
MPWQIYENMQAENEDRLIQDLAIDEGNKFASSSEAAAIEDEEGGNAEMEAKEEAEQYNEFL